MSQTLIRLNIRTLQTISIGCLNVTNRGISNNYKSYSNYNYDANSTRKKSNKIKHIAFGVGLTTWFAYELYGKHDNSVICAKNEHGKFKQGLPTYTMEDIVKHDNIAAGVWVVYKDGVYDITKFVGSHPGGDAIMLAAGSSVEPFWMMYGVHLKPEVLDILEEHRIGNLSLDEERVATNNMEDFYKDEPRRHGVLKAASVKPFNAEPPSSLLVELPVTPNEIFFVRNHLPVPMINEADYELSIEVEGKTEVLVLNLHDLKKLPKHTVTTTLMCAGNRRSEMTKVKPVKGLDWQAAAIGTATWSGPKLRDVLKMQGIDECSEKYYNHVQFEGLDTDPTNKPYGASIPLWKACDKKGDVILALEMNGKSLPRDHGYPVRVIVPGIVGARQVKWLGRIIVSKNESDSHWQQNDYKGFSPSTDWDTVDFTKSPAIQELPVISAICKPNDGDIVDVKDGKITLKGYAWSGGGHKIVRVDVTSDGGDSWIIANIDYQEKSEPPHHWAWSLWTASVPVPANANEVEVWAKAIDSAYNTQPENFKNIWNLRGVLSNAYHRIKVKLKR